MSVLGPVLGIVLALGMAITFLGVAMFTLTIAAPIAYYANMLDVQTWTVNVFGGLPWVGWSHEYGSAATFTIVYLLASVSIALFGAVLLSIPGWVLT